MSISMKAAVDVSNHERISELGKRVLNGETLNRMDAMFLFGLRETADIFDLMAWANRIREHYKGNKIHLCSIVNVKAGGCSENCHFCSQSAAYSTDAPRYEFIEAEPIMEAVRESKANGVQALGLVAAWKGLSEGPVLDDVCNRIREISEDGKVRPDASLGIIKSQAVADKLKDAGLACYNHNLESSPSHFSKICDTHSYEDRVQTIEYLKKAGIKICSGGIIGMGESPEDRCELALELRRVGANVVPINILNPIEGTPLAKHKSIQPMEVLQTIACFRLLLPKQEIMIAGGRAVNLRDLQSMIFAAGASALMVGNYLTTLNQTVEKDLQMIQDLGLDPDWDKHDFHDQEDLDLVVAPESVSCN